jgi:GntP family gluconate:H+ symporter
VHPFLILLAGVVVVVGSILAFRLHAFLALALGALLVAALTPAARLREYGAQEKMAPKDVDKLARQAPGERVAAAFGRTCATVGIIIALASIIGQCMLESGGAERIVRSTVSLLGESRAPIAFAVTGFLLSIPVFFDTVFYLMIPLAKALAARTGKNFGLYVMTIAAGATISHSLVPPTPGPLYVAGELNVLGPMYIGGIILGFLSVIPGVLYAYFSNRRWPVPLRETADVSLDELKAMSARDDRLLPPLGLSLLPILLPVVLIIGGVVLAQVSKSVALPAGLLGTARALGDSNVALGVGAAIALGMQIRYKRGVKLSASLETALASAGQIILITASGGAFGGMLQQTAIGGEIARLFPAENAGLYVLGAAFLVTALVRVAQGSATVAMVTAMGMFKSFAPSLGFHPVYLALAIGFGSKPVPWMNDSGFWVVCKMSGQTVKETLRNHTVVFTIMGFSGIVMTMVAAKLFPMGSAP